MKSLFFIIIIIIFVFIVPAVVTITAATAFSEASHRHMFQHQEKEAEDHNNGHHHYHHHPGGAPPPLSRHHRSSLLISRLEEEEEENREYQRFINSPIPFHNWNNSYAGVIKNFEAAIRIDKSLYTAVWAAIQASTKHRINGTDAWTMADFLRHLNDYLFFVGTPSFPQYGNTFGKIVNQPVWTTHPTGVMFVEQFVVARGMYLASPQTAKVVEQWIRDPAINISQYIIPAGGFTSFADFFTRNLAPGARPVDAPDDDTVIVSPVDGSVEATIEFIDSEHYQVKNLKGGMPINISALLGDTAGDKNSIAHKFVGGKGVIIGLEVTDYHRWHSPIRGKVLDVRQLGNFYWCTPPGHPWFPDLGYYFRRSPVIIQNQNRSDNNNSASGFVAAFVPVGIAEYGSCIPYVRPGSEILNKGSEQIGQFDLGGSMVFMAFDASFDVEIGVQANQKLKVGQAIAKIKGRSKKS